MNKIVNAISSRLSLRKPQKEALEILNRVTNIYHLNKNTNINFILNEISNEFPIVKSFDRDFPSVCFAIATGVGKTRLMGAFVTYLHLAHKIKHFLILAPNLTIYNKLIIDFSPNTPKYVLNGISEFAVVPPEIITGDNFETGRGIRGADIFGREDSIQINIFNISKINSEIRTIKEFSEFLGKSYFEYLSSLDDLVVIMDESHRYRASSGFKAINELKPVLGLELTATPQTESGTKAIPFNNIIYNYDLHEAMNDGYVKEPAVATRENFIASDYSNEEIERIKLEDGISIHEQVKVDLRIYSNNANVNYVKPFVLIVAQDTNHAEKIVSIIKSANFFDGRYKDKVITVHSAKKGEERDEIINKLLSVENPQEPTEIVVHVNMLKEGWDVTNLYTIIPLRAANSETLVKQSIGRGLRLPYGKRTGIPAVDRLTIVAHDKFDEIIRDASNKKSFIRTGIIIGKDVDIQPKKIIEAFPNIDNCFNEFDVNNNKTKVLSISELEKPIVSAVRDVIDQYTILPNSDKLLDPDVCEKIISKVKESITPDQLQFFSNNDTSNALVDKVLRFYKENIIDIPRITMQPAKPYKFIYNDFDLELSNLAKLNPVDQNILLQELRTSVRDEMSKSSISIKEDRPEDYLVFCLIDYPDISYNDYSDLLYKLATQMVEFVRSYLRKEEEVLNVIQFYRKKLAEVIYSQMKSHIEPTETEFDINVSHGFNSPRQLIFSIDHNESLRNFRDYVENKNNIRGMAFTGFKKCLYSIVKFDSDTERQFAILIEDNEDVLKWFKPCKHDLKIYYNAENLYQPDFIVETNSHKYIIETKMERDMQNIEVIDKMRAAILWSKRATKHAIDNNGKPWKYILIPHTSILPSASLEGLISQFARS